MSRLDSSMTVQQLIDELMKVEDKSLEVKLNTGYYWDQMIYAIHIVSDDRDETKTIIKIG